MSQAIISKMFLFVASDDVELKCAAMRVLSELGINNKKVAQLIAKNIESENVTVRTVALKALTKTATVDCMTVLMQQAEKGVIQTEYIERILLRIGSQALPYLKKNIPSKNDYLNRVFITVIAQMKTAEARRFLLMLIMDSSLEILKHICYSMRETCEKCNTKEKKALLTLIQEYIERAGKQKKYTSLTTYIILLGYLKHPQAKSIFTSFLKKEEREFYHVRRNALIGLSKLPLQGNNDALIKLMFTLIERVDFNLAKYIIEILSKINLTSKYDHQIEELLDSRNVEIRCFAILCMGKRKSKSTASRLVGFLQDNDRMIRNAAAEALKNMPEAINALIALIEKVTSDDYAITIAHILKDNKSKLTPERCRLLFTKLDKLFIAHDSKYQRYYSVLRIAIPEVLYQSILKKVQLLKGKKKFKEAYQYGMLLAKDILFTDEVKYELAVVGLKISSHDIALLYRNNDNALRLCEQLLKSSDMAFLKRLKKETVLDANDLFYLGFHFSEKLYELRVFGIDILKSVIKKYPRAKVTPKAKKKIVQVGGSV